MVDDAAAGLIADPQEAPYFAVVGTAGHDTPDRLKACLRLQFNGIFGGPYTYPGTTTADGGTITCESMTAIHQNLAIPSCVFDEFVTDLAAVLKQDGVPDTNITRVAPSLTGPKPNLVSETPVYLGPNTPANCS